MNKFAAVIFTFTLIIISQKTVYSKWMSTNAYYGASVHTLVKFRDTVFAGTDLGFFITTDYGTTWIPRSEDIPPTPGVGASGGGYTINGVISIALNDSLVFAGTAGLGLFKSTDRGESWVSIKISSLVKVVNSIILQTNSIYIGTNYGVFHSTDFGSTWDTIDNGLSSINTLMLITDSTNIFAGTDGEGIFCSTNSGKDWINVDSGLKNLSINALAEWEGYIYAGTGDGVFRSSNRGIEWESFDSGLRATHYIFSLTVLDNNLYLTELSNSIYRLSNDGSNWIDNGGPNDGFLFALAKQGDTLIVGTIEGGFKSIDNGINWARINNGLSWAYIWCLATNDTFLFAGSDNYGILTSSFNNSYWQYPNGTDDYVYAFLTADSLIFTAKEGAVYMSENYGKTWPCLCGISTAPSGEIRGLALIDSDIFCSIGDPYDRGVFSCNYLNETNGFVNWNYADSGLPALQIFSLTTCKKNLFAAVYGAGIYRSSNKGVFWEPVNKGITTSYLYCVTVCDTTIFAASDTGGGIFVSTNNGDNWYPRDNGLKHLDVYTMTASGNFVFAGTDSGGIFFSSDDGSNWIEIDDDLPFKSTINALLVANGNLYAGTGGRGIWYRPLSEIEFPIFDTNASPTLPLLTNYPNPFGEMTNVEFRLPDEANVTLNVFNSLGEEVATLANGEMPAGEHSIPFKADGLQNGIYFYRLAAGKYSQTGKMSVVR